MWVETVAGIAYAPTMNELRQPKAGGENIEFIEHGLSSRTVTLDDT